MMMMGETETAKEAEIKAKMEEAREIFSEVFLRISNQTNRSLPPPLSRDTIDNDGDDVCMNCCQKADHDIDVDMCPCWDANSSPCPGLNGIPHGPFPKKENQIPVLAYQLLEDTPANANDLLKLFNVYGPVTKVEIPTDKTTGLPENYGHVFFENVDDAERALNALNEQGHLVDWIDCYDSCLDG